MRDLLDHPFVDGKHYKQIAGESTEAKPTQGIITGSLFLEVDTMKLFAFNESGGGSWGDGVQLGSGS